VTVDWTRVTGVRVTYGDSTVGVSDPERTQVAELTDVTESR
jgi:hypothetical protein